jgi:hypothetical protein
MIFKPVGVAASAVPVALGWLRVVGDVHAVRFGDAAQEVARHVHVVADLGDARGSDLELPLAGHDLGVDDAAVVRALGAGVTTLGEAERVAVLHHRVFLLHAVPAIERGLGTLVNLGGRAARVSRVRLAAVSDDLTKDEDVVAAAERISAREHREQLAVGIVARRLVRAGTIKAPVRQGGGAGDGAEHFLDDARFEHSGLRAKSRCRLGAVDPDVFCLDDTHRYYS